MKGERGERQGKTRRGAAMKRGRRADLMQGATGKPAGKRLVKGRYAKAYETAVLTRHDCKIRNDAAQRMQSFRRFADGNHDLPISLFMFCSRIPQPAADVKRASRGVVSPV
jgi:hypothetical protein